MTLDPATRSCRSSPSPARSPRCPTGVDASGGGGESVSASSPGHLDPSAIMQLEANRLNESSAVLPSHTVSASSLSSLAVCSRAGSQGSLERPAAITTAAAPAAVTASGGIHKPHLQTAPRASPLFAASGPGVTPQVHFQRQSQQPLLPSHDSRSSLGPAVHTAQQSSELPSVVHTPRQRSGLMSLQSSVNVLTPALSTVHTPRGDAAHGFMGTGMHGLAVFKGTPATPEAERGVCGVTKAINSSTTEAAHGHARTAAIAATQDSSPVQLPILDEKKPLYGTTADKASSSANSDEKENNGVHSDADSDNSRERSTLEFNSFAAMEASFLSNASSIGSPSGGAGGYNTLGKAAFHIFKGNVGAGVFLLPTYYQDSGYVIGVVCVMLLGWLMVDCALELLRAKHAINRAEVKTYPAVVDFVLGPWFRYFTDFALIFTQFGFCIMYIQYASSIFASLTDFPHAYAVWIAITVVAVTPMTFLSNKMHLLAYASMLAGFFVSAVLAGTTFVDVQNLAQIGIARGVVAFLPSARILVFLSGHMFALEGIGIVLPVENSIEPSQRCQFGYVVKYTLLCIVSVYILFGVLGYAAYGETLHTSVVLALPRGVTKASLQLLLGLSLIFGYPIQYVPAIQLVDSVVGVSIRRSRGKAYLIRIVLNVLFGALALFIGGDALNIFASFLGAFTGVHLMITIPSLLALQLENALDPNRDSLSYWQYMAQIFTTPLDMIRARRFLYLLLAFIVWIGCLYFTAESVFGGVPAAKDVPGA